MQSTAARGITKKTVSASSPAASLQRLNRPDLVSGVVESLRARILAGAFDVSECLPSEAQLGQSLGVSRTVIREAMRILGGQGLVEVSQGRRPRIRPVDSQSVVDSISTFLQRQDHTALDLIEVRRPLETAIAALAAERATPKHLQDMEETITRLKSVSGLAKQVDADMRFHDLLAEATGNVVFQLLMEALSGLFRESLKQTISRTGTQAPLAGHRRILEALRAHDPAAARKAIAEHLDSATHDIQETGL